VAADPTAAADAQTDALLDAIGLRTQLGARADAAYALLRKARHSAIQSVEAPTFPAPPQATTSAVGPAPARLLAASGATSFGLEFSTIYATILDQVTTWSAEGQPGSETVHGTPSPPVADDDGTQTVSTTVQVDYMPNWAGSVVTLNLTGTVTQTLTDDTTHSVVATLTDARSFTGRIDVCPSAAGDVPASLTVDIKIRALSSTGSDHTEETLTGHVDDAASLANVDETYHDASAWTTNGQAAGVDLDANGISYPGDANNGITVGAADMTHLQAPYTLTGAATAASATQAMGNEAFNTYLMQPVIAAAQRLWRNGRCVVVTVPGYTAETPIAIAEQGKSQHTEEVDKGSETDFGVALKHRFGPTPVAPVDATLSGDKSVDPDHAPAAPTSLKYTAGDQDGAKADVTLVSKSKRGIGQLVIEFAVQPKKLALAMDGTINTSLGGVVFTAHVHASTAPFVPVGDGTYRASLPATSSYTITFPGQNCGSANGNEGSGSLVFNATLTEGPDNKPIWNVALDPNRSTVHTVENACGFSFSDLPLSGTAGGLVGAIAGVAGPLTFPATGGTVHVHKAFFDATFVATVPK
jgi:hypothetical protein